MALNPSQVLIGAPDQLATGAIFSAPLDTPLPTNARTPLNSAFVDSGYVSKEGIELTPEMKTADIPDWSGGVVRTLLESFTGTISWAHIQWEIQSLKNAFGDENVSAIGATADHGEQVAVRIGAHIPRPKSWVFKMKDLDYLISIVVPIGQVTALDKMVFNVSEPIPIPITLNAIQDASGNSIYIHTDNGVFTA